MRCPNCETENREHAKFCDECGFPLTGTIARVANELALDESQDATQVITSEDPVEFDADETSEADEAAEVQEASGDAEEPAEDQGDISQEAEVDEQHESVEPDEQLESAENDDVDLPPVSAYEGDLAFEEQKTVALDVDLSGFDRSCDFGERLVGEGYQEPKVDWRDGGTMKMQPVGEDEPQRGHDFLESSKVEKNNKSKVWIGAIIGIIAVAVIVAFATYQMQLWGGVALPDVTGMTEADASSVLEDQGFSVKSMEVKSDETEGLVLVMDPDAGSRVEEGSEVIVHVATARSIPSVVGKTEEEAVAAFEDEGFVNVVYEKERSDEPVGTVLSIEPEAGTRAKSAQEILVKVAEPYVVPEVAGMYLQEAQTAVEQAGLVYDVTYVNTVDYPDGQIIGSEPAAGSEVTSDTVVVIQIARARGVELEDLTRSYLAPGNTVTIGIYNYAIESLDAVEYLGSDTVAYTMTARPFTYILGETVSISARQVSGEIIWNEDNTIAGIS